MPEQKPGTPMGPAESPEERRQREAEKPDYSDKTRSKDDPPESKTRQVTQKERTKG